MPPHDRWQLGNEISRNHQHPTIDGLIAAILRGLKHRMHQIEGKVCQAPLAT